MAAPKGTLLLDATSLGGISSDPKPTRTIVFERQTAGLAAFTADQDYWVTAISSGTSAGFVVSFDPTISQSDIANLNQADQRLIASGTTGSFYLPCRVKLGSGKTLYMNSAATGRVNVVLEYSAVQ
jgi:hypothetical protein